MLSNEEYLDKIIPHLSDMINDLKIQGEWRIKLPIAINFFSSKDFEETRTMHTKSDHIEIITGNETDEIIEELFKCILQKYQKGLEESMKDSKSAFDSVDIFY